MVVISVSAFSSIRPISLCTPRSTMDDNINTIPVNSYCWLELMQIYDKISDCVYIFNKIYAAQILLMFSSWLLSTMLGFCRSLSPIFKHAEAVKTDMYYYILINLRPFVIMKMSEYFTQEWQNALVILHHILLHDNNNLNREYYVQIETFIKLVETKKLELSAVLSPVTLAVVAAFAARVISYSVLLIQLFYIRHL
ncbi:uncharacterized protein LOC123870605 [Maniola jurtina]|uniref:uncharacterized protein LOC123870605 n=1 Tax=Maniola jurtina TaxID=191418 RepID=UPI001E68ACCE|nr:uncharacterized protein LOC123870605 [Maniola jurtina]